MASPPPSCCSLGLAVFVQVRPWKLVFPLIVRIFSANWVAAAICLLVRTRDFLEVQVSSEILPPRCRSTEVCPATTPLEVVCEEVVVWRVDSD